jgi:AAA15 family ATPase/GTPase
MDEHLLRNIHIKNFKCFEDFRADGFKRVNLIGGKNNIGKTALMEACLINVYAVELKYFVACLISVKAMRENLNILDGHKIDRKKYMELSSKLYTKTNINLASFEIEDVNGVQKYIFEFNEEKIDVNTKEFSYAAEYLDNIEFIDNFGWSNREIINSYSAVQKKDQEDFLNRILNKFDKNIEAFKVIDEKPQCKVKEKYLEVTEFGDGVRHLISIVTAIYTSENGYLFIDEIDNGIHYTQLDEIWNIILEVSKELNVQVFATTHSKECIESFARVAKKLEDKDISYIKMSRLNDESIKAGVRDFEMFQDTLDDDHEVR